MRSLLLPFLLLAVFATCIAAQSTIPEKDFHIWNETTFVLPVLRSRDSEGKRHDRLSLFLVGNLRLGQNRLVPVDERIGGGFELTLNKHFSFAPTYLYVAGESGHHHPDIEHRIRFDLFVQHKFGHFTIKDRN
jgi:hypothetical protein